jgi:MinD-like ATPase involved in chromosome partitioning or flagellar assembly
VQSGKPVVVAKPGARVSQSILDLAAVLSGKEKAPEPKRRGLFGRLLGR